MMQICILGSDYLVDRGNIRQACRRHNATIIDELELPGQKRYYLVQPTNQKFREFLRRSKSVCYWWYAHR